MNKTIIAFLAVLLIALTACETRVIMEQPGVQPSNAVSVQGMSEFEVAPDLAKIRFRLETRSLTAQDAQLKNRQAQDSVIAALTQAGVRKSDIETTDYRVDRWVEWDYDMQRQVDKGYIVTNSFIVSTKELERVGALLDAGIQAGANNVDSISFELSDAKDKEVKTEALKQAAQNARDKASALADGAGVRLGKVLSLQENSYVVMPYARYDTMAMKAEMGAPEVPPTAISPQSVQVSAQVSVSYEIG